jgi:hypothetical protein
MSLRLLTAAAAGNAMGKTTQGVDAQPLDLRFLAPFNLEHSKHANLRVGRDTLAAVGNSSILRCLRRPHAKTETLHAASLARFTNVQDVPMLKPTP